jgi:FAS-associated factor 2
VAFLALQPRRSPTSLSSRSSVSQPPSLTVLSRHQGPCTPSVSGPGPTSAQNLVDHLTNQLLPRITPYLERIHASNRERELDRQLREEQDRAFKDSARKDKERIEGKVEEERRDREKARAKQEEEERKVREQKMRMKKEAIRMAWRRWTRRVERGKGDNADAKGLRIAIRLPSGARVVKVFDRSATLTTLYAFVDTNLIPPEFGSDEDPLEPAEDGYWNGNLEDCLEARISRDMSGMADWWGFRLALAYPRKEIPWISKMSLGDVGDLRGGGQVVVELMGRKTHRNHSVGDDGDDGYDTEDSD